ncbi:MAG: GNAT family N-acetyltransferase [Eubacteriales bacterium]|nr:GNAT family N-acetyltransferase [Eubacteriales bacterium]
MENIVCRLATEADESEIWTLWSACAASSQCLWNDDYPTRSILCFDLENRWLYVLCDENQLIGSVTLMPTDDLEKFSLPFQEKEKVAVMTRLCVQPTLLRRGYGSLLLNRTEQETRARGAKALHLLCDVRNAPVLALYHKADYQQLCDVRLYGDHFYVLEKVL